VTSRRSTSPGSTVESTTPAHRSRLSITQAPTEKLRSNGRLGFNLLRAAVIARDRATGDGFALALLARVFRDGLALNRDGLAHAVIWDLSGDPRSTGPIRPRPTSTCSWSASDCAMSRRIRATAACAWGWTSALHTLWLPTTCSDRAHIEDRRCRPCRARSTDSPRRPWPSLNDHRAPGRRT
jgi:hypothetical protein